MLLQNKRLLYHTPWFLSWGTLILEQNDFKKNHRSRFISESEFDKKASMPLWTEGQYSYVLAQRWGGLASYTDIAGTSSIVASQSNGINIESTLAGTSELTANANLITSMLAELAGSGTLSASMVGTVWLAASLTGSGEVVAWLKMFAWMIANLSGSSEITATMKWWANMSADIYVNQSEATVKQLVDWVWNAVATEYNTSGTMWKMVTDAATAAAAWWSPLSTEEHDQLMKTLTTNKFLALK